MSEPHPDEPSSSVQTRQPEQQPSNESARRPFPRITSPLFHWQEPDGSGYVIGGVSGFNPPEAKHEEKPDEPPQPEAGDNDDRRPPRPKEQ
jgi:hypothetical protein